MTDEQHQHDLDVSMLIYKLRALADGLSRTQDSKDYLNVYDYREMNLLARQIMYLVNERVLTYPIE